MPHALWCYRLELVADPWLDGLYPALLKFLGGYHIKETNLTKCITNLTIDASNTAPSTQITFDDTQKYVTQSTINDDEVSNSIKNKPNETNIETTCIPSTLPINALPLATPHASLSGKNLTIPVLPPPFLEAVFSNEHVEVIDVILTHRPELYSGVATIIFSPQFFKVPIP